MKHAQGFFSLGHNVEILCVQRYVELKNKLKIRDIRKFYDISYKIKIKYFIDKSPLFFRDLRRRLKDYPYTATNKLRKILPRTEDILDPERKISEYCKKNDFDLAYCRRSSNAAYYNLINRIPIIIENHNYIIPPDLKKIFKLSKSKYFRGVVIISKQLKESHLKEGIPEEKIIILDDAVDINKFNLVIDNKKKIREVLKLPLDKIILMYTGNLKEGRGLETIIKAAKYLKKDDYAFLIIGGSNNEIKRWKYLINNKGINADITFLGFKKNNLIPIYLKSADILLAPYSLKCPTVKWMSPIKLFEYMASKVPIIASEVTRIKEVCENGECLLFKVDNSKDLAEKIRILLLDQIMQEKLTQNAFNKATEFTYKKRCEKIITEFGG
jgi:glycosyltransferase involved in cell wall biosynthesis